MNTNKKYQLTKLMKNSVFGAKAVDVYKRTKEMETVKFHIKPTQVNRKNPKLMLDHFPIVRKWIYELNNGYFVIFSVFDETRSEAVIGGFDRYDHLYHLDYTMVDIHTKQDLVDFVTDYNKYSTLDMLKLEKEMKEFE